MLKNKEKPFCYTLQIKQLQFKISMIECRCLWHDHHHHHGDEEFQDVFSPLSSEMKMLQDKP